ncbi:adenosylcobinamide-GDP ribazoletransferase [Streptosporangiaceae bacterium NEAU-GS5]|nr:adenosylcobinamide-GDP ribazoletransferase [Streptosporangiaceae bacterium NEAU-GS5]
MAVGTLTILPVRMVRPDPLIAGRAMTLAPVVGGLLGAVAAAILYAVGPGPLGAVLAVAALAWLTRGLHLDGLADLADGLGSGRPAAQSLDIMKKSDIGPFGVMTLVLALLTQVAALTQTDAHRAPLALAAACVTGRLAVTLACREGIAAARPEGLGSMVAGSVRPRMAALAAVSGLALVSALAFAIGVPAWATPVAMTAGLAGAEVLRRHAVRRLGGITGDVLGALVETATTVTLVAYALT